MCTELESAESRRFAERAITESLIGAIRMSSQAGNEAVFRVQFKSDRGEINSSPYGVYLNDDPQRLTLYTGEVGRDKYTIAKDAIVGIKLTRLAEMVRLLNEFEPWRSVSDLAKATILQTVELNRQWFLAMRTMQSLARPPLFPNFPINLSSPESHRPALTGTGHG
jgi:hypothetical protein